jgi:hypothetical protein
MKTLSNTSRGIVKQTTSNAFNLSKVRSTIDNLVLTNGGITYNLNRARTGTLYFEAEFNGFDFSIRIANHSKRDDDFEVVKISKFCSTSFEYNVINAESFKIVLAHVTSLIS